LTDIISLGATRACIYIMSGLDSSKGVIIDSLAYADDALGDYIRQARDLIDAECKTFTPKGDYTAHLPIEKADFDVSPVYFWLRLHECPVFFL
jgi:hypothetical protein